MKKRVEATDAQKVVLVVLVVAALVVVAAWMWNAGSPPRGVAAAPTGWVPASGNLWVGEQLYFGPDPSTRWLVGEVLGGHNKHVDPITGETYRGLKIRYPDGHTEWKERDAVISGAWYVRADDPALAAERWETLEF